MSPSDSLPGTVRGYGLVSQFPSFSFDTRRLYLPRRAHPLHTPAAWGMMIGFVTLGSLAALDSLSRGQIEFACATAHVFASPGLHADGYPRTCLGGYMANGSFHGDLLSDHKTTIVSLTHPEEKRRGGSGSGNGGTFPRPGSCGVGRVGRNTRGLRTRPTQWPTRSSDHWTVGGGTTWPACWATWASFS